MKWAHLWLEQNGVMVQQEEPSPDSRQFARFLRVLPHGQAARCRSDIGLANSVMVMQSNLAMDEGRRAYFKEV